jgi:hypothetical protein
MITGVTKLRAANLLWNTAFKSLNATVANVMTNNAIDQFVNLGSKKGHPNPESMKMKE